MKDSTKVLSIIILSFLLIFSCSEDDKPTEPDNNETPIYTNGVGEIGSAGGEVIVSDQSSSLYNTKVVIPSGALGNNEQIKISKAESEITLPGDSTAVVVKLEPHGIKFNKPVEVTLPVNPNSNWSKLFVYFIDPDSGNITQLPLKSKSRTKSTATFETTHFSYFSIDDDGVRADVKLYYYNNKISASVWLDGYVYGNNKGLAGIHTLPMSWPAFNAQDVVDNNTFWLSGDPPSLILEVSLYKKNNYWFDNKIDKKRLWLRRTGDNSSNYGADLFLYEKGNSTLLYSIKNQSSNDRSVWFKGEPLIFHFNTSVDQASEYYIKADWAIGEGPCFYMSLCGRATEKYQVDSYEHSKTPSQMFNVQMDEDNNWVMDPFQPKNSSPNSPSNPNPSNNSAGVSTSSTLSWQCSDPDGDAITYDIYFGTSSNPSLIKSNHSTKSYYLGALNENTTYYWKIVAEDSEGNTTTGSVWKFTTAQGNQPPTTPSNPSPSDNATGISTSTSLSWQCSDPDGDAITYDIYFGTSSNPSLVKSNNTSKNYNPGSLNENTTYYWKIIAEDSKGNTTTGSIWEFTTESGGGTNNPPTTPSNPNPSDNATEVSTITSLTWECSDPDGDTITYDIYFGTSSNPSLVLSKNTSKSYNPSSLNENTTYYWKIVAEDSEGNTTAGSIWEFTTGEPPVMGEPCPGVEKVYYEGGPNSDSGGDYYNTVQINDQCWLKENLDVGIIIDGVNDMVDNGIVEKYCFKDDSDNCSIYGGLYQWHEAMKYNETEGAQGICPSGWHIPKLIEFNNLRFFLDRDKNKLLAIGETEAATNESGFTALLAGYRSGYGVAVPGYDTFFWSSRKHYNNNIYALKLYRGSSNILTDDYSDPTMGFSIRCIKD